MKNAKQIALGGILGALAVTILFLGGLIPVSTYICPVLCMLILQTVKNFCGLRMAWAWYAMVSFLALILGPDKEAAAILVLLGYYPIIKPYLDRLKLAVLWKLLLFNVSVLVMYWLLIHAMGLDQISQEFQQVGTVMTAITLALGNAVFFLLDWLLGAKLKKRKRI